MAAENTRVPVYVDQASGVLYAEVVQYTAQPKDVVHAFLDNINPNALEEAALQHHEHGTGKAMIVALKEMADRDLD